MDFENLCREGMKAAGRILATVESDPVGEQRAIGQAIAILQDVRKVAQATEAAQRLSGLLRRPSAV